jgi:DNA mismatch repair protein PMS2
MSTHSKNILKDNIIEIFGISAFGALLPFKTTNPSDQILSQYKVEQFIDGVFEIDGFVSSCEHGQGRSAPDRQYLYINKRPCENTRINKLVNEIYHQYNRTQYPMFIINIFLNSKDVCAKT